MPGAKILHLAGPSTTPLPGVDEVVRFSSAYRVLHQARVEGDCLFLDVDTVVQQDVSGAFPDGYDVAVALRRGAGPETPKPYNGGVIFCRNPAFWQAIYDGQQLRDGRDIEEVFNDLCRSGRFRVLELDPLYNWSPKKSLAGVDQAVILHYKGRLKSLMLERHGAGPPAAPRAPSPIP